MTTSQIFPVKNQIWTLKNAFRGKLGRGRFGLITSNFGIYPSTFEGVKFLIKCHPNNIFFFNNIFIIIFLLITNLLLFLLCQITKTRTMKRKSKKRKELEKDLEFYLQIYSQVSQRMQAVLDKEIKLLIELLKSSEI